MAMLNNLKYFELATKNKESLIDADYHLIVDRQVIPNSKSEINDLVCSNKKVIEYITTLKTNIYGLNKNIDDIDNTNIIKLIIKEIYTKGMNYSAFCQYFNVHNMNYSIFTDKNKLNEEEQIEFIKFIIKPYIETRHNLYLEHGYSNIVLQVMSDNYSHKRKGTYGTNKIADILSILKIKDLTKEEKSFDMEMFYLLSDKTGKNLFIEFAKEKGISLSVDGKETEKYPDALIRIGNEYYIVEQKNMKEGGGGQDKQTSEITDFIYRKPPIEHLHYITFIDGIYFNQFNSNAHAKVLQQYTDIITALTKYPDNYFVNSYAFKKLLNDAVSDNKYDLIQKQIEKI